MSLLFRLAIPLAIVFLVVFGLVGFAAVRIAGDTVEDGLESRIDFALKTIAANPQFFLIEVSLRGRESHLEQLAGMSGFEIVVPTPSGGLVAGSSLPRETALEAVTRAPDLPRFELELGGVGYRGARAVIQGRPVLLLSASAPIAAAKQEARGRVLLVASIGLVVALLLVGILAGTITRPIRRLAAAAGEVREGSERPEFPVGGGPEVMALRNSFVTVIARLDRFREQLVAREKMATLGQFSAAVAHEIRNPLSSMRMTLDMLREDAEGGVQEEVDFLRAEAARLDHSVEELLFHAGEPRYEMADIDLADVASAARQMLSPLANHLGVDLESESPSIRVTGDAGRLRQALVNLGLNALQASETGGGVTIELAGAGSDAIIRVSDHGPGVPDELADRLFAPFVSGRAGGTGLGLSVTKAIMKAHDGTVSYERKDGMTYFVLRLPAGER